MRAHLALLSSLSLSVFAPTVHAQTETRTAVAEGLYRQARDLMAAGKFNEACPKFAESQRLDPATGTLLNLAACHEKQGKLATAWIEYSDAVVAARRDGREDRVEYASLHVAELEPKLSRLTLVLAPDADIPGLSLELDGAAIGRAVIGAPTPVDPGKHSVQASAPGKKTQVFSVEVGALADQQSLTIAKLEDAPPEAPATPPAAPGPPVVLHAPSLAQADELSTRPIPTSVYVSGGITLALVAGASLTGLAYLNEKADYESSPTSDGKDRALTLGRVNLGLWIGAAVGAGVTTYLFATRPAERVALQVTPLLGLRSAGLGFSGGF